MVDPRDDRERRLFEREEALGEARAALRAEREKVVADREEADRLLAEARTAHREATETRNRTRRLAARFVRFVKHRHAETRRKLDREAAELAAERERFAAQVSHLNAVRSEFHTTAVAARDRLRDAWATVETQQKRAATEWAEANHYFTAQTEALDARATDLARREKATADRTAQAEAETAGLREEAAALEQRVWNARAALTEVEQRRDRARAELLHTVLPELATLHNPDDLTQRELLLNREKAAVAALRTCLERDSADIDDRQRLVAEQLSQLAHARAQWQRAEHQTVLEMEELARGLRQQEIELADREQRVIRADARRRTDAYDLWQLRLRLEAWQTKLTVFELRWQTERDELEADLEQRAAVVVRRESEVEDTFAKWEQARASERERLRAELEHWSADRAKLTQVIAGFDRQRQDLLTELTTHASRALAAEQLVGETLQDAGSERMTRRFTILRKRWERAFGRQAKEIENRLGEVAGEQATVEARYRQLHRLLAEVTAREGQVNNRGSATDREALTATLQKLPIPVRPSAVPAPSAELVALRAEVERLAAAVLAIELPEPPELPESELPWAIEEVESPSGDVLTFDGAKAA